MMELKKVSNQLHQLMVIFFEFSFYEPNFIHVNICSQATEGGADMEDMEAAVRYLQSL